MNDKKTAEQKKEEAMMKPKDEFIKIRREFAYEIHHEGKYVKLKELKQQMNNLTSEIARLHGLN